MLYSFKLWKRWSYQNYGKCGSIYHRSGPGTICNTKAKLESGLCMKRRAAEKWRHQQAKFLSYLHLGCGERRHLRTPSNPAMENEVHVDCGDRVYLRYNEAFFGKKSEDKGHQQIDNRQEGAVEEWSSFQVGGRLHNTCQCQVVTVELSPGDLQILLEWNDQRPPRRRSSRPAKSPSSWLWLMTWGSSWQTRTQSARTVVPPHRGSHCHRQPSQHLKMRRIRSVDIWDVSYLLLELKRT